jgi:protein tyrosine/serine phosphatase
MSCISGIFRKSFERLASEKQVGLEKLNANASASRDSLDLGSDEARKAEYKRLKKLKAPTMGLPERIMCTVRDLETRARRKGDAIPLSREGKKVRIQNFGQVDSRPIEEGGIFRGAMPQSGAEYEKLVKKYNIKHIIDLRGFETTPSEYIKDFAKGWSEFHGIKPENYHHIPMQSTKEPSTKELEKIFRIIDEAQKNGEGVYIHCKHGIDRTGSICAAIEERLGLGEGAYKRMKNHGYNKQHQKSKPAQKAFVTGDDFAEKVRKAEELRLLNASTKLLASEQMSPARFNSVKKHLEAGHLDMVKDRIKKAEQTPSRRSSEAPTLEPWSFTDEMNQAFAEKYSHRGYQLTKEPTPPDAISKTILPNGAAIPERHSSLKRSTSQEESSLSRKASSKPPSRTQPTPSHKDHFPGLAKVELSESSSLEKDMDNWFSDYRKTSQ